MSSMTLRRITITLPSFILNATAAAQSQTVDEGGETAPGKARAPAANVVSQAEDAFGFRAGPEDSGLYDAGDVRGFDPVAAGNIRIDGLYADLQGVPSDRLSPQSAVRVGAATAGTLLPGPTGLVDYALANAAAPPLRVRLARESFGLLVAEVDSVWRVWDGRWSLNAGASFSTGGDDFRGTRPTSFAAALVARWRPIDSLKLTAFHDVVDVRRHVEPLYYPAGETAPPRVARDIFLGQPWSKYHYTLRHSGLIAELAPALGFFIKGGAFHSINDVAADTFDLFETVDREGVGRRSAYLFPPQRYRSNSGEAQLGYRWGTRFRQQAVVAVRRCALWRGARSRFARGIDLRRRRCAATRLGAERSTDQRPHAPGRVDSRISSPVGSTRHWRERRAHGPS
jgi:iron complex outermembrane receptor protein